MKRQKAHVINPPDWKEPQQGCKYATKKLLCGCIAARSMVEYGIQAESAVTCSAFARRAHRKGCTAMLFPFETETLYDQGYRSCDIAVLKHEFQLTEEDARCLEIELIGLEQERGF